MRVLAAWSSLLLFGCAQGFGKPESDVISSAIVGGRQAGTNEWSSTVHLVTGCTGTVVGERHVLTAAHCVVVRDGDGSTAVVRSEFEPGGQLAISNAVETTAAAYQVFTIEATHLTEEWREACGRGCLPAEMMGDVAVITFVERLPTHIPRARVDVRPVHAGDRVVVVGYGREDGAFSTTPWSGQPRRMVASTEVESVDQNQVLWTVGQSAGGTFSLAPGDSGGPVYRSGSAGLVVGVNSAVYVPPEVFRETGTAGRPVVGNRGTHTGLSLHEEWLRELLPPESIHPSEPVVYIFDNIAATEDPDARYGTSYVREWTRGTKVQIRVQSSFDSYLVVTSAIDEAVLLTNDDSDFPENLDAALNFEVTEGGTFRIWVTTFDTGVTGPFFLTIENRPLPR